MEKQKKSKRHGIENLKPFQPGKSGNPNGRPKGSNLSLTTILKRYLDKQIALKSNPITGEQDSQVSVAEMLVLSLIKRASQGSDRALELILDRIDGKIFRNPEDENNGNGSNISIMLNFFKTVEMLGKDGQLRDRLTKALEGTEVISTTELLQDQNQEPAT